MEQLYTKFKSTPTTVDYCVSFYNENSILINNVSGFNTEYDVLCFTEMYYGCINSLVQRNQYNKAIDSIVRVLPVLENGIAKFNINKAKFHHYVWLLWQQGIAYYYLKDYSQSIGLFTTVNKYEPDNDKAKEWLERSKTDRLAKYPFVLWILVLIFTAGSFFGKNYITHNIRSFVLLITFLILLSTILLEFYIRRKRLRVKR